LRQHTVRRPRDEHGDAGHDHHAAGAHPQSRLRPVDGYRLRRRARLRRPRRRLQAVVFDPALHPRPRQVDVHAGHAAAWRVRRPHLRILGPHPAAMSKEISAMKPLRTRREGERGQILVLFTIAIVVIIGMLGLVLDGGSAFAQRRDEQNVSDLASIAGADAYLTSAGDKTAAALAAANLIAQRNGYVTDATTGVNVEVVITSEASGASVKVTVTKPHANNFSTILGMPTWGVSAKATAQAAQRPNGVLGAMPLLFNEAAFPNAICNEQTEDCGPKTEIYQLPGTGN